MNQIDKIIQIINQKLTELDQKKNIKGVIKRYLAEQKYIETRNRISICNTVLFYYKRFGNKNIAKNCVAISQYGTYTDGDSLSVDLTIKEFRNNMLSWDEYSIKVKQKYIDIKYSTNNHQLPEIYFKENTLDILEKELGEIEIDLDDE